jgi:hypothetical protein
LVIDSPDNLLDNWRLGAFHGTDLEMILSTRSIDTVIISGIATNVCCQTPAREAMVRYFRVLFLSERTATTGMGEATTEELQKATLAALGTVFGQVRTLEEEDPEDRSCSTTSCCCGLTTSGASLLHARLHQQPPARRNRRPSTGGSMTAQPMGEW